ncbi:MAG TPA: sulfotransferase [Acidimicrobiia bacterium]|nr:sulfotransferase [Acidimicrobiia bacterium]
MGHERLAHPTFLVIGAMRGGTTTLYQVLRTHPSVFMASVKETNFFAFSEGQSDLPLDPQAQATLFANSITSADKYVALFQGSGSAKATGEVSPSYLYSPGAAARISDSLPDAKIVALLRDPVERAYSAYLRRSGVPTGPESFITTAETEHRKVLGGERLPHYPLIVGSMYAGHLDRFLSVIPRSQLWVGIFEDFWSNPDAGFAELQSFLDIEPFQHGIPQLNKSGVPRFRPLDKLLRGGARAKSLIKSRLPARAVRSLVNFKQRIEDWSMSRPEILPAGIRTHLLESYFDEDIQKTERMLGRDLALWRRP